MDVALLAVAEFRELLYYGAIYGITVAVAYWIYRDARRRGRSSGRAGAWAVATLLLTIVAVLPYLYLRWRAMDAEPAPA